MFLETSGHVKSCDMCFICIILFITYNNCAGIDYISKQFKKGKHQSVEQFFKKGGSGTKTEPLNGRWVINGI